MLRCCGGGEVHVLYSTGYVQYCNISSLTSLLKVPYFVWSITSVGEVGPGVRLSCHSQNGHPETNCLKPRGRCDSHRLVDPLTFLPTESSTLPRPQSRLTTCYLHPTLQFGPRIFTHSPLRLHKLTSGFLEISKCLTRRQASSYSQRHMWPPKQTQTSPSPVNRSSIVIPDASFPPRFISAAIAAVLPSSASRNMHRANSPSRA